MRALYHILAFLLLLTGNAFAQSRDRTVHLSADSLAGYQQGDEQIRRLVGNVSMRQGDTYLRAEDATQLVNRHEVNFNGNVVIIDKGDTLYASYVTYNTRDKVGQATGDLRLSDGDVEVFAPSAIYWVDEKRAQFDAGVRLIDSVTVLTSRAGEYLMDEKQADFFEEVVLREPRTYLEADSVTYHRETKIAIARGNVYMQRLGNDEDDEAYEADEASETDTLSVTYLFSEYAYNDEREGLSKIHGDPLLVRLERDSTGAETDTLIIRALRLEAVRRDSLEHLTAVGDVRLLSSDMSAQSDSLVFNRLSIGPDSARTTYETVHLFGRPIAWYERSQVFGDTLITRGRNGDLDSLIVRSNAFAAELDTVTTRIRQLQGGNLLGLFRDDSLRVMTLEPNAIMLFFMTDEEDRPDGAVKTSGDRAIFRFNKGELENATIVGGTEGTYYPEDLMPKDINLERYRWEPERRPTREQLLNRPGAAQRLGLDIPPAPPAAEVLEP